MHRKQERDWKANITLHFLSLILAFFLIVSFGHCESITTFEGRVIDADTLEPIEGALVVAIWMEWKGGGLLYKERFRDARECLTNHDGKWVFQGLAGGTRADSDGQILLSFLTGYRHEPPQLFIYKKGYTGVGGHSAQFTGFIARPYRNSKNSLEGIMLLKMGNTQEAMQAYREKNPNPFILPLIEIDKPEQRLRSLDFDFSYGPVIRKISADDRQIGDYVVYGLEKTTDAKNMRNGNPSLPIGACNNLPITCKHKRGMSLPVGSIPTVFSSGSVIEKTLKIGDKPD